jgi:hypothetical protein
MIEKRKIFINTLILVLSIVHPSPIHGKNFKRKRKMDTNKALFTQTTTIRTSMFFKLKDKNEINAKINNFFFQIIVKRLLLSNWSFGSYFK